MQGRQSRRRQDGAGIVEFTEECDRGEPGGPKSTSVWRANDEVVLQMVNGGEPLAAETIRQAFDPSSRQSPMVRVSAWGWSSGLSRRMAVRCRWTVPGIRHACDYPSSDESRGRSRITTYGRFLLFGAGHVDSTYRRIILHLVHCSSRGHWRLTVSKPLAALFLLQFCAFSSVARSVHRMTCSR